MRQDDQKFSSGVLQTLRLEVEVVIDVTGYTIFFLGTLCAIAAIVGGDVSLPFGVKYPTPALGVRVALGVLAALLALVGVVLIFGGSGSGESGSGSCSNPKKSASRRERAPAGRR